MRDVIMRFVFFINFCFSAVYLSSYLMHDMRFVPLMAWAVILGNTFALLWLFASYLDNSDEVKNE